jgi:hypothetical protein
MPGRGALANCSQRAGQPSGGSASGWSGGADTVLALTPGASESLVRPLLAHEERVRDSGQVALSLGLLTAVVALTTAVGRIERGANRIYWVDQDRPVAAPGQG